MDITRFVDRVGSEGLVVDFEALVGDLEGLGVDLERLEEEEAAGGGVFFLAFLAVSLPAIVFFLLRAMVAKTELKLFEKRNDLSSVTPTPGHSHVIRDVIC